MKNSRILDDDPWFNIIKKVAIQWNQNGIEYAVIHGLEKYPIKSGRDLDIFIKKGHIKKAKRLAIGILQKCNYEIVAPDHDPWPKNSIYILSQDSHLELDLIWSLSWGPVPLLQKIDLSNHLGSFRYSKMGSFAKVIVLKVLSGINIRHITLNFNLDSKIEKYCTSLFGRKLGKQFFLAVKQQNYTAIFRLRKKLILIAILRAFLFSPFSAIKLTFNWFWREVKPFLFKITPIVAIVGPDGVGKSTTIKHIHFMNSFIMGTVHRHWRPQILPSLAKIIGKTECFNGQAIKPRREPGKFYTIRLFYYALDFLGGHYLRDRFDSCNLRLVLYDRYWLDQLVDPLRYGLSRTTGIRLLWRILPKPDLIILLDDDPDKIYIRKPELTTAEIIEQLEKWKKLVIEGHIHAVIKIQETPEQTAALIKNLIIQKFIYLNMNRSTKAIF